MLGIFANKLTEYSNNIIDWSRVAELVSSGSHRYSRAELLVRLGIVSTTAASAFVGWSINNSKGSAAAMSNTSSIVAFGLLGFIVSHTVAIWPLIQKRWKLSKECLHLASDAVGKINSMEVNDLRFRIKLRVLVGDILKFSLSDDKHSKASQTWGRRKRLLNSLVLYLDQGHLDEAYYLSNSTQLLISDLCENPEPCSCGIEYKKPPLT